MAGLTPPVDDETTAQPPREYRCHWPDRRGVPCGGLLLRSRDKRGVIQAVFCPKCKRRTTVYLGGRGAEAADERAR